IARVDAARILGDPARVLPALVASERAMPTNYNASLRLAEIEVAARQFDLAVAACDRGLAHVTGPMGKTWLLETKADALIGKHESNQARRTLEEALLAARAISGDQNRDRNVA